MGPNLTAAFASICILATTNPPASIAPAPVASQEELTSLAHKRADEELLALRNAGVDLTDAAARELLARVTGRLLAADGAQVRPTLALLADRRAAAFSLPNGVIAVSAGLLGALRNEAQLAAVLGREVAHLVAGSSLQWLRSDGEMLTRLMSGGPGAAPAASRARRPTVALDEVIVSLPLARKASAADGFGIEAEARADVRAVELLKKAGYDSAEAAAAWQHLAHEASPLGAFQYADEQAVALRRQAAEQALGPAASSTAGGHADPAYDRAIAPVLRWLVQRDEEEKHPDAALAKVERLLAVYPDELRLHYQRGLLLAQSGANEKAMVEFALVLEKDPKQATTHRDLGLTAHLAGKYDQAVEHLQRYLALRPDAADKVQIQDVVKSAQARR